MTSLILLYVILYLYDDSVTEMHAGPENTVTNNRIMPFVSGWACSILNPSTVIIGAM